VKFIADDDKLVIKLQGMEIIWGLQYKLVLQRNKIVDLVWTPEFNTSDIILRIGGSNIPRVLLAGHFRDTTAKETIFLFLRRPKGLSFTGTVSDTNVLSITMQEYPYAKVIVNCDPETGASLMNWFKLGMS
jgi:hypothetical protein